MFRRTFSKSFFTLALLLVAAAAVLAQNAPVRGRVEMKDADGKPVGVPNVVIDCYRTDINGKFPAAKTDKKGVFTFAGLPLGATFLLVASGPGINAELYPNVKAGREDILINVVTGDGKALTEAEARERLAGAMNVPQSTEMTAEQKKAQEEYEAKVNEVKSKNEKIKNQTAAVQKALDEGTVAFKAKDFTLAVAKFEEGFQANPDFVGSAPVLLNNKGAALKERAVMTFNAANLIKDPTEKTNELAKVLADLGASADCYNQSYQIIKSAPQADIIDPKTNDANKFNSLNGAKDAFRLMSLTRQVDTAKTDLARTMIAEYITVETDAAKKLEAQRIIGDIFLSAGDADNAIVEYKKVLEMNPTDADGLAGVGLGLIVVGYTNNDKTKFQEAADYLQKFIDVAPPTHKLLQSVKDSINDLKASQNVAPTKGGGKTTTTTTTKKKP